MKYNIILLESWMGDTLWASNVIKNLTDAGYDIILTHKWPFMMKLIDLFEINHNCVYQDKNDYEKRYYTHRIDHYQNPLLDYAISFNIPGVNLDLASKFYSIEDNLRKKYNIIKSKNQYITYDSDWQNRTRLNVEYIINTLKKYINVIPVGGDRFTSDPDPLIESSKILVNSLLHLGMIGGTTNLASYLNTLTIGSTDHLYSVYSNSKTPEEFLDDFHAFSRYWANSNHITIHPHIDENQFINQVLNQILNENNL
jgi:hypothetical protein